jgi:hypothetical protein
MLPVAVVGGVQVMLTVALATVEDWVRTPFVPLQPDTNLVPAGGVPNEPMTLTLGVPGLP